MATTPMNPMVLDIHETIFYMNIKKLKIDLLKVYMIPSVESFYSTQERVSKHKVFSLKHKVCRVSITIWNFCTY